MKKKLKKFPRMPKTRARLEPMSFCLADLKKAYLTSMPSASRSSVAVNVSASQLIKLIKSVTSLVLKKKKSLCYSLRFLRKAPTKKSFFNSDIIKIVFFQPRVWKNTRSGSFASSHLTSSIDLITKLDMSLLYFSLWTLTTSSIAAMMSPYLEMSKAGNSSKSPTIT